MRRASLPLNKRPKFVNYIMSMYDSALAGSWRISILGIFALNHKDDIIDETIVKAALHVDALTARCKIQTKGTHFPGRNY